MRLTTGFGTPETGEALGESTKLFDEALNVFIDAQPRADSWDGAAAEEYGRRDHDQKDRASLLYAGDDAMWGAFIAEAAQVGATRDTLDDWSRYLWDFGLATFAIGLLGPYGRAAQLALDAGAAPRRSVPPERACGTWSTMPPTTPPRFAKHPTTTARPTTRS